MSRVSKALGYSVEGMGYSVSGGMSYSVEGFCEIHIYSDNLSIRVVICIIDFIKVCILVCCHRFPRKKPMLVLRDIVHQVSCQGRKDTFLEYFTNNIQERYRAIVITGTRRTFLQLGT